MTASHSFVPARLPTESQLADAYFIEHRAKLLDLAAFLDRVDRAGSKGDPRLTLFRRAIPLLVDGTGDRARRILELFSDPTTEPVDHAGTKGAIGAWAPAASQTGGTR